MVRGENRAAMLKSLQTAGKSLESAGEGIQNLTLRVGKGIADCATGTVDAIIHPQTIPDKLENLFDRALVQPTLRTVDFFDQQGEKVLTDRPTFRERVKQAQKGTRNLKVIFAQPLFETNWSISAVAEKYPKSEEDTALICAALDENFVFSGVPLAKRHAIVGAFEPHIFRKGERIIEEGDAGDYFYVLGAGTVEFIVGGKVAGTAGKGSSFGELALLYNATRAATVVAKTQCGLFRLDQETFRRILAHQIKESRDEVIAILKTVPYFKELDDRYLNKITNNLKQVTYQDGDVVASKEEDTPKMFGIVREGAIYATGIKGGGAEYTDVLLPAGKYFGEIAIAKDKWPMRKATARGKTVVLLLDRDHFIRAVGDLGTLLRTSIDKKKLQYIPYGKRKGPAENELDLLAGAIKEKKFPAGHVFFVEGKQHTPALYLVRKGKVSIQSCSHPNLNALLGFNVGSDEIKTIGEGGYFGNDTLGHNEKGRFGLAQYTVVSLDDVEAGVLDLEAIRSVTGDRLACKQESIGMADLDMIRILGAGTFGKVWLVTRKGTDDAYALKIQVKKQLIEYNQVDGVIREKNIMAKLDHPFIIKMASHWKDEDKLYMLLRLYQGGELQTVIHTDRRDGIPESAAKFYAANILEGLSHMHHRHILYRDLKPENVLLDSDGYTVIVDLGFAKIIRDKTYTFCGTPLYLAPEIIMQKGHDKGADHWSWGVMLYEMIVGMTPFYTGVEDQMGLFKNIVKCRIQEFPEGDFMSNESKDLILKMLTVNPSHRLGSFAFAEHDIKEHDFFDGFDWEGLAKRNAKVPMRPTVSDPLDGSNFDDYSKLEAKAKKEKYHKLTGKEQKLFDKF